MKIKRGVLAMFIALTAFSAIGCSKDKVKDVPVAEIQAEVLVEELLPNSTFDVDAKDHWIFEDVKDKIVEGFVSQAMINVRLQDVIVVKTTDTDAIVKAIEAYKEGSLQLFAGGYGGEDNATSVANSILEVKGDYVYFIATPNASDIEAKILKKIG